MPYYRREGKIQTPLTDQQFIEGMRKGRFVHPKHKGLVTLYYYSAVRKTEGIRAVKEQFQFTNRGVFFSVGKRLKRGIETPPLFLPKDVPYMYTLIEAVEQTKPKEKVFPYSPKTAYNIVRRVFKYPHLFRLSRITNFFLEGWTIAQVHSWTGLTLNALNYYVGLVDVQRMGESLAKKRGVEGVPEK